MGSDLLLWIGKGVECIVDLFPYYLVLNAHDCVEEDVIFRLGFDAHVKLLDTCVEGGRSDRYVELELELEKITNNLSLPLLSPPHSK